jgi:uracil-DNA glycosylase
MTFLDFGPAAKGWAPLVCEFAKPYMLRLNARLQTCSVVHPCKSSVFEAFARTALDQVKVVILGLDPYPDDRAMGLAFAIHKDADVKGSIINIYTAVDRELNLRVARTGDLGSWAEQGVLLLNCHLTVGETSKSHSRWGWRRFTNEALELIPYVRQRAVFILWGDEAKSRARLLGSSQIIAGPHPARLNQGFLDRQYFSTANRYLKRAGEPPICWNIPRCEGSCLAPHACERA